MRILQCLLIKLYIYFIKMTYSETLSYLYNKTPLFQQIGTNAYKKKD